VLRHRRPAELPQLVTAVKEDMLSQAYQALIRVDRHPVTGAPLVWAEPRTRTSKERLQ
jgi:ABC-type hemin transport system ATPase subunit